MQMVRMGLLGLLGMVVFLSCARDEWKAGEDAETDFVYDIVGSDGTQPADLADMVDDDQSTEDGSIADPDLEGDDELVPEDVVVTPPDQIPPHDPAPLEIHQCKELPALAEGECARTDGSNGHLLIQGIVLGVQDVWVGGDVLIDSWGIILCAGCDCSSEAEAADATVIMCPEGIVSPGLINAHEHITYSYGTPNPSSWGDER